VPIGLRHAGGGAGAFLGAGATVIRPSFYNSRGPA
jgi:hypothetical protein